MSFAVDVKSWAEKTKGNTDDIISGTCLDLSRRVILRTPVDSGQARWNWQASIGSPKSNVLVSTPDEGSTVKAPNPSNASTRRLNQIAGVVEKAPGNIFYLTNNMPYIDKLEFGGYPSPSPTGKTSGGFSTQSPSGMVRITIREFNQIFNKQAAKKK